MPTPRRRSPQSTTSRSAHYLLKPWDPPEEELYPVVEDLLNTWEAGATLEAGGVRIVGHRFSRDSHELRDCLARNRIRPA